MQSRSLPGRTGGDHEGGPENAEEPKKAAAAKVNGVPSRQATRGRDERVAPKYLGQGLKRTQKRRRDPERGAEPG